MQLKRWEIALLGSLLAVVLVCANPAQTQAELSEKLIRLHVLANSDTPEDQELKLKVRDGVLAAAEGDTPDLEKLQQAAQAVVAENGYDYPVRVTREYCWFDTRVYDTFSLPAGYYDAVRVLIGEGEGKNWWCVVYPPLCAGVCEEELAETAKKYGWTEKEISLICEEKGYIIRFRLADLWGKLQHLLQK